MPYFDTRVPSYKPAKQASLIWDQFRGGLNTLLAPAEIASNELVQADNLYLVGKGVPKQRGGTADYFLSALSVATGASRVRGLKGVLFASGSSGANELLAINDDGLLVKKSGASFATILGASYASGYPVEFAQAFNQVYIANGVNALTRYSGVTIFPYIAISMPTGVTATNISGGSGTFTYNWRISAVNAVGETLASSPVSLANLPQSLTSTRVRIEWTTSSPSSGVVAYNIYGRRPGREVFLTSLDASSLTTVLRWEDDGTARETVVVKALPPTADTTAGPVYKYHIFTKDKIVGANVKDNPCRVVWSGGGTDNIDKFHFSFQGGYVDINANSGEFITGLRESPDNTDTVIVFMSRSIWGLQLNFDASLGLVVPKVTLISRSIGCLSHRSIAYVENDVYFLGRGNGGVGIYVLGYEPNITSPVLRTNKVSAKVDSFFTAISEIQASDCVGIYFDKKYRLTRPDGREIIFDRERLAFMGPNTYGAGKPGVYEAYYDGANEVHLLWGDNNDNFITEFTTSTSTDKGVAIASRLITKKETFNDPFSVKNVLDVYTEWRNLAGTTSVDVVTEDHRGTVGAIKSFEVSGGDSTSASGWGFDRFGTSRWGNTAGAAMAGNTEDVIKRYIANKPARTIQLDVRTTSGADTYELLAVKFNYRPMPQGILDSTWNV